MFGGEAELAFTNDPAGQEFGGALTVIGERLGETEVYRFENLLREPGLTHFISTRKGGISAPPYEGLNFGLHVGDRDEDVVRNRHLLMDSMGIPLEWVVTCRQVHAGNVSLVTLGDRGRGSLSLATAIGDTDALITSEPNICLAVMLADCVPVVLYDRKLQVGGVAHSGWKGTVLGVTTNAVRAMVSTFGCSPLDIVAGIGPSIGPDRYEIGADVAEKAQAAFPGVDITRSGADGREFFDLWTANLHQLLSTGVPRENIEIAGLCTYTLCGVFFSERRQRPTGRFVTALMLNDRI